MPQRTVKTGVATYVEESGLTRFALLGSVVDVADTDIERFDRLNGDTFDAPVVAPPAAKRKPGRPRKTD